MLYILQVIAYTGLMLPVYILFLRNKSLHRFNRIYLLACMILPVVIPFIKLPEPVYGNAPVITALQMQLPEIAVSPGAEPAYGDAVNIIWLLYGCVTAMCLCLLLYRWVKLKRIIRNHEKETRGGYTLVYDTGAGPGSWMRYILLPGGRIDETVLKHELVHIQRRHSIDIVLAGLVQAVFWPNIFLVFIKKELVQVHEFEADAGAGIDAAEYSQLLLRSVFNTCTLPMTHSFIIHPIKRRIMMLKNNSKKTPFYAGIAATALTAFLVFNMVSLQSCKPKAWEVKQEGVKEHDKSANGSPEDALKLADKMPEFNGNFTEFMVQNTQYPEAARTKGAEGKVFVQFIVDKDGTVKEPKILKSPDTTLSIAALETVSKMPRWIPGENEGKKVAVYFTLPVLFKLK